MNWRRSKFKLAFGFSLAAVAFLVWAAAAATADNFAVANRSYDEGKFAEAIGVYETIEPKTAHLHYNLGNACFRNNQLGKAILNYERARRLSPRDPDILANLKFSQERLGVDAMNTPSRASSRFAETVFSSRTVNNWSVYVVVAVWLTCLAIGLVLWVPQARAVFVCVAVALCLWLAFVSSAVAYRQAQQRNSPPAIVLVKNSEARFAPLPDATVHFKLAEGTKVGVREDRGEWLLVERADTQQGWVKKETVERVGRN